MERKKINEVSSKIASVYCLQVAFQVTALREKDQAEPALRRQRSEFREMKIEFVRKSTGKKAADQRKK